MVVIPRLVVEIVGDTRNLERAFGRSSRATRNFNRDIGQTTRGVIVGSGAFSRLGRAVTFASGTFLGAAGLGAAMKVGFDEMLRGEAVAADTAAVLKSTGRIAGVTAKQVEALGRSLQRMSGFDDEAIKSAENLILTFTNIRNVAGENNDIFNQTVKATLDMSRRFDQDLSVSAVQLGKALQDPVRGMTALRRIGISFSKAQERLIKRLVDTGRLLDAQKVLLREVTRETGGAAAAYGKTMAGQIDILQGNLSNLAGELAQVLNPEVRKLTDQFNKWLENPEHRKQIIEGWTTAVNTLGEAFQFAADTAGFLKDAWNALPDFSKDKGLLDLLDRIPGSGGPASAAHARAAIAFPDPKASVKTWGGDVIKEFAKTWADIGKSVNAAMKKDPLGAKPPGAKAPTSGDPAKGPAGVSQSQRNAWFDTMIGRLSDRVQDIKSLQGQVLAWGKIAALVRERLSHTKDITRTHRLEDQLLDIAREQRMLNEEIGLNKIEAKRLGAARAREKLVNDQARLAGRIAAAKASQFRALGLTGGGDEIVAGQRLLRQQLGRVSDAVAGTFLDTSKTQSVLARVKKVLGTGLNNVGRDVRAKVKEILDGINDELNKQGPQTKFHKTNVRAMLRAAGLDPDEVKRVSASLSRVGAGGMSPGRGQGAFGMALTSGGTIVVNHTSILDGKVVARSATKHQQKTKRRNPEQKRGPFAGGRIQ